MRVDEYNSFESLLRRYSSGLTRLMGSGVRVSERSRLRSYERRLKGLLVYPRPTIETSKAFAASVDLREIDEIIEIVENLEASIDAPTFELLNKLTGGNDHPDGEASSAARDAQYELYLGTVLRRAGTPVCHGAPDITAKWQGEDFFIEAKRPGSARGLDGRLRSAVHQLRKLSRPGILAVSADQLLRPSGCSLRSSYTTSSPRLWMIFFGVSSLVTARYSGRDSATNDWLLCCGQPVCPPRLAAPDIWRSAPAFFSRETRRNPQKLVSRALPWTPTSKHKAATICGENVSFPRADSCGEVVLKPVSKPRLPLLVLRLLPTSGSGRT